MIEFDETRPKWRQVEEVIRGRIESGEYPSGHRLSEVALEAEFGVSRLTIRKATKALREAGLIRTEPGMGSFVR
ncbi:DNA-binding GntR family transcriptional regulator [Spinactinospora alkalitolerans]|uniref:DNA-binding GntR family transcriptional regulator n=1 Tax=Spinactinospora alkalitolerans TaxID=687207 RepID=A0A852TT68_9ACTN|nr:GntR family transcriptional regulator [Spinactinospora alkalitolerans]NYE47636.1 DNA-binding GntR family transcriptional regulator [Spinactinospora alkalitolerans]